MIKYNTTGNRDKEAITTWYHKKSNGGKPLFPSFNLKQCFFGEHLLKLYPAKPIAIVESEKTAIIASVFMERYIWLASGGSNGISHEKCQILNNRSVTLFPDLGKYHDWKILANKYRFNISNHIEKIATEEDREKGLDLADYLIK